jgi:hypothetical protein
MNGTGNQSTQLKSKRGRQAMAISAPINNKKGSYFVTAQVLAVTYSYRADELCGGRVKTRAEILFCSSYTGNKGCSGNGCL